MVDRMRKLMNSMALNMVGPQVEETRNKTQSDTLELCMIAKFRKASNHSVVFLYSLYPSFMNLYLILSIFFFGRDPIYGSS
jgi:hypothetical protein